MKYTIEIDTDKVFTDGQNNKLYRAKGFNSLVFDKCGLDKLEPIEKTWESELEKLQSDAYEEGYDAGYKDGKSDATYNTDLIDELKAKERQEGYDVGYTQAIADYRKFERFFNSVGGIEVFEDIRNTDGTLSIDMILQYLPMPEIMARIKAYEEKKKVEEVENYHILVDTLRTVTEEYPKETIVSALSEFGFEVDKLREEK